MNISFAKMHGLGNDFVVIDLITQNARLNKSHFLQIANRNLGIGCDQIILLTPPTNPDVDFNYKIINADGKEAEECVNGIRCAAKYFFNLGLSNNRNLVAESVAGQREVSIEDEQVIVNLQQTSRSITKKSLEYHNLPQEIYLTSLGNPHAVLVLQQFDNHLVKVQGRKLSHDAMFPEGANIGFMQVINREKIKLRVYERGAGLTAACGSGAVAAVLVAQHLDLVDSSVKVSFRYGELTVHANNTQNILSLSGPATAVFIGRFKL